MRYKNLISIVSAALVAIAGAGYTTSAVAESWPTDKQCKSVKDKTAVIKGWCAAINRTGGNCLACHSINVTPWPEGFPPAGNIAPPLVAMKARFPDKEILRAQVWDATANNPASSMPPFGKHKLVSEEDIDNIVELLYSI